MVEKYKMSFSDFEDRNTVKQRNFSWEVESDSMEWEHALSGIEEMEKKINALKSE